MSWVSAPISRLDGLERPELSLKVYIPFPGAETWRWDLQESQPLVSTYFSISDSLEQRKTSRVNIHELQNALVQTCNQLAQAYGKLKCPLTGGRDSRLLAALLKQQE